MILKLHAAQHKHTHITLEKETDICHERSSDKRDAREGATSHVVSAYAGLNPPRKVKPHTGTQMYKHADTC